MRSLTARALPLLVLALLAACADGGPSGPAQDRVASVALSHDSATVLRDESLQLGVSVRNASGVALSRPVEWSSTAPAVASVADGLVRGVSPGTALVVASSGGRADTARITVVESLPTLTEARALWVNRFEYVTGQGPAADQARIAAIMQKAADAHFNVVYFQVRGQGDAYYRGSLEPCAIALCGSLGNGQPSWDPLEVAVREAHARGLQLHAWLNALSAFAAPRGNTAFCANLKPSAAGSPPHMLIAHPEWAMVSSAGAVQTCEHVAASHDIEYVYVSPGIPAVRTHLARVAADVARRYAVDGIHLDRIRYPGTAWSHDSVSLRLFGRDPAAEPAAWEQFRRERVNLAVKETYDSIRAATPRKVPLSAAVWGIYDDLWGWSSSRGVSQYFQDPRAWAREGYLDVAVPMTYYNVHSTYCGRADWACLLDDHLKAYRPTGRHLYIGIAANIPDKKGTGEVVAQIEMARSKGAQGVAIYSYNSVESTGLWSVLKSGPFRQKAEVPPMGWR